MELYLSSDADYQPGDLITQSHLEEIQTYLRRTQGNSSATHYKWRRRMLLDSAPLVKMFYSGDRSILRKAAHQLGGYGKLDQLSRSGAGRRMLLRALEKKTTAELVQFFASEQAEAALLIKSKEEKKRPVSVYEKRIYTAADFVAAVTQPLTTKPVSEEMAAPVSEQRAQ